MSTLLDHLLAKPVPLKMDEDGVLRVGNTRIPLETIISSFESGNCPEEIVWKYPSLDLTDVYSIVTYYLWHKDDFESYLSQCRNDETAAEKSYRQTFLNQCPSASPLKNSL